MIINNANYNIRPLPNMNEKERLELLDLLWEYSAIGLAIVGEKGEWVEVNPALCRMLEYTRTELLKMTFQQVTHPDDVDADEAEASDLISSIREVGTYEITKRYIPKFGPVFPVKLKVVVSKTKDGKFQYFLSQILKREFVQERVTSLDDLGKVIEDVAARALIKNMNSKYHISTTKWLKKNWFWLAPLASGIGYCLVKAFNLILVGIKHTT